MSFLIRCPNCKRKFEISQILEKQIKDKALKDLKIEQEKELARLAAEYEEKIRKEIEKEKILELTDLKKAIAQKENKLDELFKELLKLKEENRSLQEKDKEREWQKQKEIDELRKKIEEKIILREEEKYKLKEKEKEKIINDLKKSLEEAQRRASLSSQQLQGEVLELDLEKKLSETFPDDIIEPIAKGVKGADVCQEVRSPQKKLICGKILWEAKRTSNWQDKWITKLKIDMQNAQANIPVLISMAMPKEIKNGLGLKNGVWVVSYSLIIPLAVLLRKNLLDVTREKIAAKYKDRKADILYQYITGYEFRQQVETMLEVYLEMKEQICKERAAFERIWKTRESQLERIFCTTAGIVGRIQGKIGQSSLQIKGIELLEEGK